VASHTDDKFSRFFGENGLVTKVALASDGKYTSHEINLTLIIFVTQLSQLKIL